MVFDFGSGRDKTRFAMIIAMLDSLYLLPVFNQIFDIVGGLRPWVPIILGLSTFVVFIWLKDGRV